MTDIKFQCKEHGYQNVKEINYGKQNVAEMSLYNIEEYIVGFILECECRYIGENVNMIKVGATHV